MKTIDTLVPDIYALFDPDTDHEINEENLDAFADNLKALLRTRLQRRTEAGPPIRFSGLGKPDRQIWYAAKGYEGERLQPKQYLKFLYGDVIEQVLLLLAKEAGHEVTHEQHEVEVDGVLGHLDAVIDGHVVDVKSASPFGFQKFKDGGIFDNDSFGYIPQLSGYANEVTPEGPAPYFLAMDKVDGELATLEVPMFMVKDHPPSERISHLKSIINSDTPPERCFEDVPDGKSGNRKLPIGCSYCAHKFSCWDNLRVFLYSGAPRFLTHVEREPNVQEVS